MNKLADLIDDNVFDGVFIEFLLLSDRGMSVRTYADFLQARIDSYGACFD